MDSLLKWWERSGLKSVRRKAITKASEWMIERLHHSEGLGAIYPPMMYSVMALDVLGYAPDHPLRVETLSQFNSLMVDDGERFFFQPCFSPVWDTANRSLRAGRRPFRQIRRSAERPIGCWRAKYGVKAIGR